MRAAPRTLAAILLIAAGFPLCRHAHGASRQAEVAKYRVLRANVDNAFLHQFLSRQKQEVHPATGQIRDIGARIVRATGNAFGNTCHFYIVDQSTVNALASPGGNIFIYRGLLDLKLSRDETAAFIAHEVSHIVQWHWLNRLQRQMDSAALAKYTAKAYGRDSAQIAQLSRAIENLKYSQKEELDADAGGLQLMVEAGFSPKAMVSLLKKVDAKVGEPKPPKPGMTVITDHPSHQARIDMLQDLLGSGKVQRRNKRLF